MKHYILILFLIAIPFNISAQLLLPSIFSDNMVLQRNMKIPVWGFAAPNAEVSVKFHGQKRVASADKEGNWMIYFKAVPASAKPESMEIESGGNKINFTNVLVGEVWLCSGQSNMGSPLKNASGAKKYISEAKDSRVRFFQANMYNFKPYECINCVGNWSVCTTNSVKNLTAVGYIFGLELLKKLDVPIGLIQIEFGGTIIESWMKAADLQRWPVYTNELTHLAKYKNYQKLKHYRKKEKEEWIDKLKKVAPGFKNGWMNPGINVSNWEKIKLPRAWDTKYLKGHKGIVWYRKKINIPADWNNKNIKINLSTIFGYDIVWFNGKMIGITLDYFPSLWARIYKIAGGEFKTGENTIVICNISSRGRGGPCGTKPTMRIYQKDDRKKVIDLTGEWLCKKGYAGTDLPKKPISYTLAQNTLSVHYNSRIHPVIPFAIRGAIWYQGESNRHNSERYEDLFTTMIKSWRDEWEEGDFPFYFVQIAPYNYGEMYNSAYVQEAQFHALKVTNTGMAVTMDIGEIKNIHPKNKKDVGHRLALWALAKDYGFTNLVYSGPLYKDYKIKKNKIIVFFDYAKGLKTRDGKPLTYFEIAGKDRKFYPASAVIKKNKIVVLNDKVTKPVAVRFAWSNTAEPNLCNEAGLPASPFRTDGWETEK